MGDFFELEYRLDEMTEDLWSKVFRLCSDLGQNNCLGCSKALKISLKSEDETDVCYQWRQTWKRLTEFLTRKLGPSEGTRLLGNHANMIPRGVIDER